MSLSRAVRVHPKRKSKAAHELSHAWHLRESLGRRRWAAFWSCFYQIGE